MIDLSVTAIYAGLMGLWVTFLANEVGRRRRRHRVLLGDGGVKSLEQAIRAHANTCETVPIALVLLALAEAAGAPGFVLHLSGLALVVGRLIHGVHFLTGRRDLVLRIAGMSLTALPIVALSAGLVGHGLWTGVLGG